MRPFGLRLLVLGGVLGGISGGLAAHAQGVSGAPAGDTLRFTLDRPGAASEHYTLELNATTRQGIFTGSPATGTAGATGTTGAAGSAPGAGMADAAATTPISASPELVSKAFAAAPLVKSNRCASRRKVAQTGTKTLHLVQNGTVFECTYNYSEDERVNAATALFGALAETMQIGERLQAKLRFDRLGLDAEMDDLQSALTDGRALEVGNIAPVLAAIQNDERVMERVRRKAAHLLESAGKPAAAATPADL